MTDSPKDRAEELLRLALLCEEASGADRALGREVLFACGKGFVSPLYRWLDPTTSLDAALSLLLPEWDWQFSSATGTAYVWHGRDRRLFGHHLDAPLAITAAALKARAGQS